MPKLLFQKSKHTTKVEIHFFLFILEKYSILVILKVSKCKLYIAMFVRILQIYHIPRIPKIVDN